MVLGGVLERYSAMSVQCSSGGFKLWYRCIPLALLGLLLLLSDSYFVENDALYSETIEMRQLEAINAPMTQSRKSVLFVSQHPTWGSSLMRGYQIMDEWKRKGDWYSLSNNVATCNTNQHADICIFIGPCKNRDYPRHSHCKIKILDVVDKYLDPNSKRAIERNLERYHAVIVNNSYRKQYFQDTLEYKGKIKVLLHHSDPRWHRTKTKTTSSSLQFGFIGTQAAMNSAGGNFLHNAELREHFPISIIDTENKKIPSEVKFEMDISIRSPDEPVSKFKTSAKVATAAALGHNIVTTWEEATKDCLPPDYPFALNDSSIENVTKMFELAVEDYEGDQVLWKKGLEIMKEVNEKLSLVNLASEYEAFLDELVGCIS